jgi:alpha-1,3-rhamnosyl/mannosyltransferase
VNVTLLSDLMVPPLTGVGRYAHELAANLQSQQSYLTLALLSYRGAESWGEIEQRLAASMDVTGGASWTVAQLKTWLVNTRAGAAAYRIATRTQYARFATQLSASLVHAPTLQMLPVARNCRNRVVTVHDASHCINPEWHPAQRVKRLNAAMRELACVDAVIAVSQSTADALIQQGFVQASAVSVVHNGVTPLRSSIGEPGEPLLRRGVVCVSTIEPRKNIGTLLHAYSTLPDRILDEHPLTLIGEYGWNSGHIHARIRECQAAGWLHYPGYVSDAELGAIYAHARLAVYPSFYEGFGLPVLEAFASGTPVIAGNHSSIPEVAGGHAHLLDDVANVDEMREAILMQLRTPWNADVAKARTEHAQLFTWKRATEQTVCVYQKVWGRADG